MPNQKLTMTINEVAAMFRASGISIEVGRLADGIASGDYPIGRVVRVSPTGRRTFEIWRVDVLRFLESKTPTGYPGRISKSSRLPAAKDNTQSLHGGKHLDLERNRKRV